MRTAPLAGRVEEAAGADVVELGDGIKVLEAALLEGMAELVGVITGVDDTGLLVAVTVFTRTSVRVMVWVLVEVMVSSLAATIWDAARQRTDDRRALNFMVSDGPLVRSDGR